METCSSDQKRPTPVYCLFTYVSERIHVPPPLQLSSDSCIDVNKRVKTSSGKTEAKSETSGSEYETDSSDTGSESGNGDSGNDSSVSIQGDVLCKITYRLADERAISLKKNYICHMCASMSLDQIAIASTDLTATVYDLNGLKNVITFQGHTKTITNAKFNPNDPHQLITSSVDGTIRFWDTRKAGKSTMSFKDDTANSGQLKSFLSFDISKSGHFLCAGTELFEGDAFLVFGDARTGKVLGGYWESHSDDINQVSFHPLLSDSVASGSSDGLINIYDLKSETEDDALVNSLNTESTVDKLSWYLMCGAPRGISCILDTMDVQLWTQDGASPSSNFSRRQMSRSTGWKSSESYTVNIHQAESGDLLFLAGGSTNDSECLALLQLKDNSLQLESVLPGNKQRVRCSWYNSKDASLVTAGEGGILSFWKPGADPDKDQPPKVLSKVKSPRTMPY